jgi:hypothetical protein
MAAQRDQNNRCRRAISGLQAWEDERTEIFESEEDRRRQVFDENRRSERLHNNAKEDERHRWQETWKREYEASLTSYDDMYRNMFYYPGEESYVLNQQQWGRLVALRSKADDISNSYKLQFGLARKQREREFTHLLDRLERSIPDGILVPPPIREDNRSPTRPPVGERPISGIFHASDVSPSPLLVAPLLTNYRLLRTQMVPLRPVSLRSSRSMRLHYLPYSFLMILPSMQLKETM